MLLSCTYVNDLGIQYLGRHCAHALVVVPALRFALPSHGADLFLPDAHLRDVLLERSRHAHGLALSGVVALELPRDLGVAELVLPHAHLAHGVFKLLLDLLPLCSPPAGELGGTADRTVFIVAGVHSLRTAGFAQVVWYLQYLDAPRGICPAGDC